MLAHTYSHARAHTPTDPRAHARLHARTHAHTRTHGCTAGVAVTALRDGVACVVGAGGMAVSSTRESKPLAPLSQPTPARARTRTRRGRLAQLRVLR
eukprot:6212235-Pleurochrysis_carterae.AAC.1